MKPKRRQENGRQNYPFWACNTKKSTHSFFGAWSFFLVHIRFIPSEGPKAFQTKFSRSRTMEVGTRTWTIEKGPLPWSDFMIHIVNQPLVLYFNWFICCVSAHNSLRSCDACSVCETCDTLQLRYIMMMRENMNETNVDFIDSLSSLSQSSHNVEI